MTGAVCLTLGTGIGSAFVADGEPVNAGPEVPPDGSAHLLSWGGTPLEETVSRRAMRRRFMELSRPGAGHADVHDIAELARAGDPIARQVFYEIFTVLGACLGPWIRSFRATALVVGGSVAGAWDLIDVPLHAGLRHVAADWSLIACPAAHNHRSALIGAARHATNVGYDPELT